MKIAIVGAGAMGSIMGGLLKKGGAEVMLVDPFQAHMEAIAKKGLTLRYLNGTEETVNGIHTFAEAKEGEKADFIFVQVKGQFMTAAMENVVKLAKEDTVVAVLMNGWGAVDIAEQYYNPSRIVYGPPMYAGRIIEPGIVEAHAITPGVVSSVTSFASKTNDIACIEKVKEITKILKNIGIVLEYDKENTEIGIWTKIALNSIVNAGCGITRIVIKDWYAQQDAVELSIKLGEEVCRVANAMDIPVTMEMLHKFCVPYMIGDPETLPRALNSPHLPSMGVDMRNKKVTEVDFINGAIVREGKRRGIGVPYNETFYHLVKIMENTYDKQVF